MSKNRTWLMILAAALSAFLVYAGTLGHELVWDDAIIIGHIERITAAEGPLGLVGSDFMIDGLGRRSGNYRPLILISFWLDSFLVRIIPGAYHLTNVLLHAAAASLVFVLLRLLLPPSGAGFGAALFAVHPIHVEPVAWVSGRTDLMAAVFVLLSAFIWLRERRRPDRKPWAGPFLGGGAFLLGLLCKETALLLPVVLIAWDLILLDGGAADRPWIRRHGRWLVCWTAAVAVPAVIRFWLLSGRLGMAGGADILARIRSPQRLSLIIKSLLVHAKLLVWPWPLNAYYTEKQLALTAPVVIGAAAFLAVCLSFAAARHRRLGLLALAWSVGLVLPVSGFFSPYVVPVADRFLYLPSLGICLLAGYLFAAAGRWKAAWRWTVYSAAAAVIIAFGWGVVAGSRTWKDEYTLFSTLARTSPGYGAAHHNLGAYYEKRGMYTEAVASYRKALELEPDLDPVYYNLGILYRALGDQRNAVHMLSQAVERGVNLEMAYNDLAVELANLGEAQKALRFFDAGLARYPGNASLRHNRGLVLEALGRLDEAIDDYRAAVAAKPNEGPARHRLASAYLKQGRRDLAVAEYEALRSLDPKLSESLREELNIR